MGRCFSALPVDPQDETLECQERHSHVRIIGSLWGCVHGEGDVSMIPALLWSNCALQPWSDVEWLLAFFH
ncbi:hypothetical protein J2S93_002420 [Arthrobacter bambusae]|uniref:Uncharacterized protein n=1 Tax=Arthrobacter bambusae TaxID=1338426 RepID=A0ABT9X6K2_9MICC|nr:hypothetical protein [Arthrobacter bambusae]MDQ0180993.1 hypothetical protein [Arthrobacter bambusae]